MSLCEVQNYFTTYFEGMHKCLPRISCVSCQKHQCYHFHHLNPHFHHLLLHQEYPFHSRLPSLRSLARKTSKNGRGVPTYYGNSYWMIFPPFSHFTLTPPYNSMIELNWWKTAGPLNRWHTLSWRLLARGWTLLFTSLVKLYFVASLWDVLLQIGNCM